jgi:hypothetical protein
MEVPHPLGTKVGQGQRGEEEAERVEEAPSVKWRQRAMTGPWVGEVSFLYRTTKITWELAAPELRLRGRKYGILENTIL